MAQAPLFLATGTWASLFMSPEKWRDPTYRAVLPWGLQERGLPMEAGCLGYTCPTFFVF